MSCIVGATVDLSSCGSKNALWVEKVCVHKLVVLAQNITGHDQWVLKHSYQFYIVYPLELVLLSNFLQTL